MDRPASILIIDDDPGTCETVGDVLRLRGHTVETAARGGEGLDKLRARGCDAVIVDIKLPDVSGLEILQRIKSTSWDTEVIFITGYASLPTAIQAINGAAFAYLVKPFVNLVTNAQHALRATPPPRSVTLTSRFDPVRERVSLELADTGPGIPSEIQGRIFEPFFTTKPPGQGTGLGLFLCQAMIQGHRGTITLESAPGKGAVFRVDLPVEAAPSPAREVGVPDEGRGVGGKAILVVDDEPEVAALLADLLARDGHRVDTAANGVVALERLEERAYDLVVTDMRMPELDGPGLYRELARRHPGVRPGFIFLTGDTFAEETSEFLEETGAASLSKPFALEEVRQAVQRALRGR